MTAKKNTTAAAKAAKFENLRRKAIESGLATESKVNDDPYILGEDFGFDPEIKIDAPSLESMLVLQKAITAGDVLDQATTLFGAVATTRIVRRLDQDFDAPTASQILTGIILDVTEHFWGRDAAEVEEGFTS